MEAALVVARVVLAGVFALAGAAKLADLPGSRAAVEGFGIPRQAARPLGTLLPFAELATAVLLLFESSARTGAVLALTLLLLFSAGIGASIARGVAPDCHCFGQLHSEPAGPRTLARNLALAALAGFAAFAGGDPGPGVGEMLGDLSETAAVALGGAVALVALAVAAAVGALSLLREHGRLLLRVEALEAALRSRGIPIPEVADPSARGEGLPIGEAAPEFSLPGLHGDTATLASLRAAGRPVLLVFTDPNCGPCRALMPSVGRWQREHAGALSVAVISRGVPEASRAEAEEHGLGSMLFEREREVSEAYRAEATPSAVLVDDGGRIASAVAAGDKAIEALLSRALRPELTVVRQAPAPPPTLAIGEPLPTPAPFHGLDGEPVEIGDALGGSERVLLLWDPACGFCRRMLDDLRATERDLPDPAASLLVVSRGTADANRDQNLVAPMLIEDEVFALGRAVGAPGTPSAVRIDAEGRITSEVAVGADAVLALIREHAGARS